MISATWPGTAGAKEPAASSLLSQADQHVSTALKFQLEGDLQYRDLMLKLALRADADHAAAHWHSGHVRLEHEWVSFKEAEQRICLDPRLTEYKELKRQVQSDPQRDLHLARFCERKRLKEYSRYHWARVLQFPECREQALRRLDLNVIQDGSRTILATADELARRQADQQQMIDAWQYYGSLLRDLQDDLGSKHEQRQEMAAAKLADIQDPLAIPALEAVFSTSSEAAATRVVYLLHRIPEHAATMSLVRHAVFSPYPQVRKLASQVLKERPIHDFAPALLDQLVSPVKSQYYVDELPDGSVTYLHDFYREGPSGRLFVRNETMVVSSMTLLIGRATGLRGILFQPTIHSRRKQREALMHVSHAIADREGDIARFNREASAWNSRLISVLSEATGQRADNDPLKWWSWWQRYNELYTPGYKPLVAYYPAKSYWGINVYQRYMPSCFPAGTPVATDGGLAPIESIQVGGRVLSQDVESGELAYKFVIGTTVRPATELLLLNCEGEEIQATRGHPFWVIGKGWRMAKFIKPGDRLHTPHGGVIVDSVAEQGALPAYNLIVEDFDSYFVGTQRLLVHDNKLRRPTLAVVPGLRGGDL